MGVPLLYQGTTMSIKHRICNRVWLGWLLIPEQSGRKPHSHSIHTFTMIVVMCAAGGILTIVMYGNKYIYNVKMG